MTSLTRRVLEYQRSGRGLERAYAEAAPIVYQYPSRHFGFSEDDCGEFLLFFHRTLLRLFDQYEPSEKPFEAYLYGTLKWQIRSFAKTRQFRARRYEVINHRDVWEEVHPRYYSISVEPVFVGEATPTPAPYHDAGYASNAGAYPSNSGSSGRPSVGIPNAGSRVGTLFKVDAHGRLQDPIMRRRVRILALKACLFVEPPLLDEVAHAVEIPVVRLEADLARARRCMGAQIERISSLQHRRVRIYVRLRRIHDTLLVTPEIEAHRDLIHELFSWHKRLRVIEDEISRVPRSPTNGEIAKILGLPKGTVDSNLFYFKRLLRRQLRGPV